MFDRNISALQNWNKIKEQEVALRMAQARVEAYTTENGLQYFQIR